MAAKVLVTINKQLFVGDQNLGMSYEGIRKDPTSLQVVEMAFEQYQIKNGLIPAPKKVVPPAPFAKVPEVSESGSEVSQSGSKPGSQSGSELV